MWRLICVLLTVGMLQILACKTEVPYEKNEILGHWTVYGAERDGKETTLLNGAIFQFHTDGTMKTNVTGEEHSGQFEVNENRVSYSGTEAMLFEINALNGDTLSLKTELQGMRFILDLQRTNTESH